MAFKLNTEKKSSINKCIRFPKDMETKIEKISKKNNITFSRFVIEACTYALNDLEKEKKIKS